MSMEIGKGRSVSAWLRCLVGVAVVAAISGCATMVPAKTPEQVVAQRAAERWQLLMAGNLEKAYAFMAPSYRAITNFESYSKGMGSVATWVGAEVLRVECESAEKCSARIKIEAKPLVGGNFKGTIASGIDETWLLENGQWWLFQKL